MKHIFFYGRSVSTITVLTLSHITHTHSQYLLASYFFRFSLLLVWPASGACMDWLICFTMCFQVFKLSFQFFVCVLLNLECLSVYSPFTIYVCVPSPPTKREERKKKSKMVDTWWSTKYYLCDYMYCVVNAKSTYFIKARK